MNNVDFENALKNKSQEIFDTYKKYLAKQKNDMELGKKPVFDIYGFAQEIGLIIEEVTDAPDTFSGSITGNLVKINAKHHLVRQRFTLAHEVGHYILHLNDTNTTELRDDRTIYSQANLQKEAQANFFAANILLNDDLVTDFCNNNIFADSYDFDVSRMTFEIKKNQLGIKDEFKGVETGLDGDYGLFNYKK